MVAMITSTGQCLTKSKLHCGTFACCVYGFCSGLINVSFYSNTNTKRFKKPLGVGQDSSLDSQSDISVLDMEILGDHIYYIHHAMFSDVIRNDDTSADLLHSFFYGSGFTDMVFLHHSLQPGRFNCVIEMYVQFINCLCIHIHVCNCTMSFAVCCLLRCSRV